MQEKNQLPQSHNLTQEEMRNLQIAQNSGTVKMIPANKESGYEIKEHDAHLIHVELEQPDFDKATGTKKSKPFIQCFYPAEFEKMVADKHFSGYNVKIIHDPRSASASAKQSDNHGNDTQEKPLKIMNKAELIQKYKSLYDGNEPEGAPSNEDLRKLITERMEFLEEEANSAGGEQNQ